MRFFIQILAVATAPIFISGCNSPQPGDSALQIDNGFVINSSAKNRVGGVVLVFNPSKNGGQGNYCSGTVVSTNTVLLAGHCAFDSNSAGNIFDPKTNVVNAKMCIVNEPGRPKDVCSERVMRMMGQDIKDFHTDVALIKFPNGSFTEIFPLATVPPSVTDDNQVLLVGYSERNLPANAAIGDESKRWGKSTVKSIDNSGVLTSLSKGTADGVLINVHDSGGPMLHHCRVAGVAVATDSTYDSGPRNVHLDITQPTVAKWLADAAKTMGAHLCRGNEVDAVFCPANLINQPDANPLAESATRPGFPCKVNAGIHILVVKSKEQQAKPNDFQFYFATSISGSKFATCENVKPEQCNSTAPSFKQASASGANSQVPRFRVPAMQQVTKDQKHFWSFVVLDGQDKVIQSRAVSIFSN